MSAGFRERLRPCFVWMTARVEDVPLAGIETILVERIEVDANAGAWRCSVDKGVNRYRVGRWTGHVRGVIAVAAKEVQSV